MANKNLNKAKEAKKDEFYTQLEDINNELRHYREHFHGKTVLCNCDDPRVSAFFTYFAYIHRSTDIRLHPSYIRLQTCIGDKIYVTLHFLWSVSLVVVTIVRLNIRLIIAND